GGAGGAGHNVHHHDRADLRTREHLGKLEVHDQDDADAQQENPARHQGDPPLHPKPRLEPSKPQPDPLQHLPVPPAVEAHSFLMSRSLTRTAYPPTRSNPARSSPITTGRSLPPVHAIATVRWLFPSAV